MGSYLPTTSESQLFTIEEMPLVERPADTRLYNLALQAINQGRLDYRGDEQSQVRRAGQLLAAAAGDQVSQPEAYVRMAALRAKLMNGDDEYGPRYPDRVYLAQLIEEAMGYAERDLRRMPGVTLESRMTEVLGWFGLRFPDIPQKGRTLVSLHIENIRGIRARRSRRPAGLPPAPRMYAGVLERGGNRSR